MIIKTKEYGNITATKKTLDLLEGILLHAENQYCTDMECAENQAMRDYFEKMMLACSDLGIAISEGLSEE
jgi:hypothetical protein